MKLRCKISQSGQHLFDRIFDQEVVKIGRLSGSDLVFEGIGRMHAVLERGHEGWHVIDLQNSIGTKLNGVFVDQDTALGSEGKLEFGSWCVEYQVLTESVVDAEVDPRRHHQKLAQALLDAVSQSAPEMALGGLDLFGVVSKGESMMRSWHLMDDGRKREMLRLLVSLLRQVRQKHQATSQMIASMLRLGAAGISGFYDLSPAEALVQARTALFSVVQSRQALMELQTLNLRNTMLQAGTGNDEERQQSVKEFVQGHNDLEALLQEEMALGLSALSVCLSRAGGHVLTHRERVELRQAFEKIEKERAATASTSA